MGLRFRLKKILAYSFLLASIFTFTTPFYMQAFESGANTTELLTLVNNYRRDQGVAPLIADDALTRVAEMRAQDMLESGYFAHTSPSGKKLADWLADVAYNYTIAGENIAYGYTEAKNVLTGWIASNGHRENLLRGSFTEVGLASISGYYNGKVVTFTVAVFGNPKESVVKKTVHTPSLTPFPKIPPGASSIIPKFYFSQNLRFGMKNLDVYELQERLAKEGFLSVSPTGYFGNMTLEAVTKFQNAHGIRPLSGFVGPLTRAELNAA